MKMDVLSLPHPVLGRDDDVAGVYQIASKVILGQDEISIKIDHELFNKTIENLLLSHEVGFCVEVNCPQTLYRETFLAKERNNIIEIPSDKLRGTTYMYFFIVATRDIPSYTVAGANEDYQGFKFEIKKGDVLGYGGHNSFYAGKDYAITNAYYLITVKEAKNEQQQEFRVDLDDDHSIVVYLSKRDFEMYRQLRTGEFDRLFHSSIAVPVLMQALYKMIEEENDPESSITASRWYQILEDRRENENLREQWTAENVLILAQTLLESPLTGTLERFVDNFE